MLECVQVKLHDDDDGGDDSVLPYLYLLTRLESVVLFLLHYLNTHSALQYMDAGVAQIFTYKVF